MPTTPTRRARLRADLTAQIIEIGRGQLEAGGVANVNWRGIATEIGMNPASLYTYVDGINDLYTRILGDSFRSLADAIERADLAGADLGPGERLIVCARAYRQWAVEQPNQFNLIFTNQIPGYSAPEDGPAYDAAMAVNAPFERAIVELATGIADARTQIVDLPHAQVELAYALRSMMHGFTILEINHHSPYVSDSDALMVAGLRRLIESVTSPAPSSG